VPDLRSDEPCDERHVGEIHHDVESGRTLVVRPPGRPHEGVGADPARGDEEVHHERAHAAAAHAPALDGPHIVSAPRTHPDHDSDDEVRGGDDEGCVLHHDSSPASSSSSTSPMSPVRRLMITMVAVVMKRIATDHTMRSGTPRTSVFAL